MSKLFLRLMIIGVILFTGTTVLAEDDMVFFSAPVDSSGSVLGGESPDEVLKPRVDLAWFCAGLRDLGGNKNKKLRLSPVQAKKILTELNLLVEKKLVLTESPKLPAKGQMMTKTMGDEKVPNLGGGKTMVIIPGGGGGMIYRNNSKDMSEEKARKKAEEQMRIVSERIEAALDKMEKVLRSEQTDYILNLEFNPAYYGLAPMQSPGAISGESKIKEIIKKQQEGTERLVKLNNEVLRMLRKLGKG